MIQLTKTDAASHVKKILKIESDLLKCNPYQSQKTWSCPDSNFCLQKLWKNKDIWKMIIETFMNEQFSI